MLIPFGELTLWHRWPIYFDGLPMKKCDSHYSLLGVYVTIVKTTISWNINPITMVCYAYISTYNWNCTPKYDT